MKLRKLIKLLCGPFNQCDLNEKNLKIFYFNEFSIYYSKSTSQH